MKIVNKKRFPKKFIAISIAVLLLASTPFIYVYAFNGNLFGWNNHQSSKPKNSTKGIDTINYSPATKEQQDAGNQTKSGSSDTPSAPTPIPNSTKKNVQLTITAAQQNGSTLQIRVMIGAVEGAGVCTLTLTSVGQSTVTKTTNSQALASTSTCQGFDIPISELPAGTWRAIIEYNSTALTGSATQDIVVK